MEPTRLDGTGSLVGVVSGPNQHGSLLTGDQTRPPTHEGEIQPHNAATPYSTRFLGVCSLLENIGFAEILIILVTATIIVAPVVIVVYLIRNARGRL